MHSTKRHSNENQSLNQSQSKKWNNRHHEKLEKKKEKKKIHNHSIKELKDSQSYKTSKLMQMLKEKDKIKIKWNAVTKEKNVM